MYFLSSVPLCWRAFQPFFGDRRNGYEYAKEISCDGNSRTGRLLPPGSESTYSPGEHDFGWARRFGLGRLQTLGISDCAARLGGCCEDGAIIVLQELQPVR